MGKRDSGAERRSSSAFSGLIKFCLFLVILLVALAYTFGKVVPPGKMGVRQVTLALPFGLPQGFSEKGLDPGYHWNIPFYTKIHIVPQNIQLLHIHRNTKKYKNSRGALEVQTLDGSSVIVDISVFSRFYETTGSINVGEQSVKHGGPADLVKKIGLTSSLWINRIREVAVDELKRALANLTTSQFYDPAKREARIRQALKSMNTFLAPFGVEISAALLRRYTYGEERIDTAIFAKNLQDQEERLNKAASELAGARAALEEVAASMDAKIKTLKVEGENRVRVLTSEGDLYKAEQIAKGDLVVAKAKAEVDRIKAEVLAVTEGADIFVAREMSPLLNSLGGGVVTDVDPYDVKSWMEKFGIDER